MTISIKVNDDYLVVSNPVSPKKKTASSGIGLKNLASRCRLMTDREISVREEDAVFTVKIPIIS